MEQIENLMVRDDWWHDADSSDEEDLDIPDWYDNPD